MLRAKLLDIAARRGEKGFSNLIREAVESYLVGVEAREEQRRRAIDALGSVAEGDADRLEESARRLRERWR